MKESAPNPKLPPPTTLSQQIMASLGALGPPVFQCQKNIFVPSNPSNPESYGPKVPITEKGPIEQKLPRFPSRLIEHGVLNCGKVIIRNVIFSSHFALLYSNKCLKLKGNNIQDITQSFLDPSHGKFKRKMGWKANKYEKITNFVRFSSNISREFSMNGVIE